MLGNNMNDSYSTTFSPRAALVDQEEETLSDIEDEDKPVYVTPLSSRYTTLGLL
jgi:hypothetical protein